MRKIELQVSRWANNSHRLNLWIGTAALMLLPVLAVGGTDKGGFIFLGVLLTGVGIAYELAARVGTRAYRPAAGIALTAGFLLCWINGAIGIIGSDDNPANNIFYIVPAVAVAGAILARFQPYGMTLTMVAAAVAQAIVFVGMLLGGLGFTGPITVFFTALWLTSAWLFRKAAREQTVAGAVP